MAKVKKTNGGKQPGKQTATAKVVKPVGDVLAVRNGRERTFTRQMWDNLPADKAGYEEVTGSGSPKVKTKTTEGTGTGGGNALTANQEKELYNTVSAEYKELFGEDAPAELSTADLQAKIAEKNAETGTGGGDEGENV